VVKAIAVELHQRLLGQFLALPLVLIVPPRHDRTDVQVFGPHQQLDVRRQAMNVQIARPPPFLLHIDEPLHLDRLRVG